MKPISHIGIIMDGNRRWAKQHGLKPWQGHQQGAKKLAEVINWFNKLNVKEITFYIFSIQNFRRSEPEKKFLFALFIKEFSKILNKDHQAHQNQIKIRFLGRLHLFPKTIQEIAEKVMDITKNYNKRIINFAFAYGGREEIIDAVNRILKTDKKNITEKEFEDYLYNKSRPEIIIRTSGEKRISNFLIFQAAYSELFFVSKHWPDFDKEDLQKILQEYQTRERRFGE